MKAVYNKAVQWGLYKGENPCLFIKKFRESGRSRFVQPGEEMRRLQAAMAKDEPKYQAFFYCSSSRAPAGAKRAG